MVMAALGRHQDDRDVVEQCKRYFASCLSACLWLMKLHNASLCGQFTLALPCPVLPLGLLAVRDLTFDSRDNNVIVGQTGLCAQLGLVMLRHLPSRTVVLQACMAVRNLAYGCLENAVLMCAAAGTCESIVDVVLEKYHWSPHDN